MLSYISAFHGPEQGVDPSTQEARSQDQRGEAGHGADGQLVLLRVRGGRADPTQNVEQLGKSSLCATSLTTIFRWNAGRASSKLQ